MAKLYTSPPKFSQMPTYIRDDMPVYRLREDIYTDDTLFTKGSTIETDNDFVPNEHMFPVNDMALKNYRAFLKAIDEKAKDWDKVPMNERSGFLQWIPRLPQFEREWQKVVELAKGRGMHICQAIDRAPAILGAPRENAPKIRQVDMTAIPQVIGKEIQTIVQGNKQKENSSVDDVQAALGV